MVFEPTGTDKLRNTEIQLHKRKTKAALGNQSEIIKIKNYSRLLGSDVAVPDLKANIQSDDPNQGIICRKQNLILQ